MKGIQHKQDINNGFSSKLSFSDSEALMEPLPSWLHLGLPLPDSLFPLHMPTRWQDLVAVSPGSAEDCSKHALWQLWMPHKVCQ